MAGEAWDCIGWLPRGPRFPKDPLHLRFRSAVWILRSIRVSLPSEFVFGLYLGNGAFFGRFGWNETTGGRFRAATIQTMYDSKGFGSMTFFDVPKWNFGSDRGAGLEELVRGS